MMAGCGSARRGATAGNEGRHRWGRMRGGRVASCILGEMGSSPEWRAGRKAGLPRKAGCKAAVRLAGPPGCQRDAAFTFAA